MEPYWVAKFRDLPEIPSCKLWQDGMESTPEQDVFTKVLQSEPISDKEEEILKESIAFYNLLIPLLREVNFRSFSEDDFKEFKGYFNYAFNHFIPATNDVSCNTVFRVVKNVEVLGVEKSVPNISFIGYPPAGLVKRKGKLNRANTPDYTVFYGADSIDSALMEIKPQSGELITVGIWNKIDPHNRMLCYPISHAKKAIEVNPSVKKGYKAFENVKNNPNNHAFTVKLLELVLDFLGEEYAKEVNDHLDYFYSAIYSERIFDSEEPVFDGILYPSVKNKYEYENLAIRASYFDEHFRIANISEILVDKTFYNIQRPEQNYAGSRYVTWKYRKEPKQLGSDGSIIW